MRVGRAGARIYLHHCLAGILDILESLLGRALRYMNYSGCPLREAFGIYCPGCGGLRAFKHFIHLEFIRSFLCNPTVDLAAILLLIYALSAIIPAFRPKALHGYIFIAVVLTNWLLRNILLLFGVLIPD